jgi:hypothetical protein
MDFSAEELFEAIDRLIAGLLERAGIEAPPVDALYLAKEHLGIPITIQSPPPSEAGDRPRVRRRRPSSEDGIVLTAGMTREQRHKAAAEGIALALAPQLCRKLGLPFDPQERGFLGQLRTLFPPRLLLPSRMFRAAQRECQRDLLALQERFSTASAEMIALRWLDLDEPAVISFVDDGVVSLRRSNCGVSGKNLLPVEQQCYERVALLERPHRLRQQGWTVRGWPLPERLVPRIVLHSTPDDV